MFSPYYAAARRRGLADPYQHCAINLALYGPSAARWTMTERSRSALVRTDDTLAIGRSILRHASDRLLIDIDEVALPRLTRVRGQIVVALPALTDVGESLDARGRHRWTPFAPLARVSVRLTEPALTWSGNAYLDGNHGDEPLEEAFSGWHWSRASTGGEAKVLYDIERRDGSRHALALRFDANGTAETFAAPPASRLPPTRWRIVRVARSDPGAAPRLVRTLEDAPFYARSEIAVRVGGVDAHAVHESLSLDRFRRRLVQAMLPFRMPRRAE